MPADLSEAELFYAKLNDADLTGANLSDVVGWSTVWTRFWKV